MNMTVGQRFKEQRQRLGLTQRRLGEKTGILLRSIQYYESDQQVPSFEHWQALLRAGVDIF